MSSNGVFRIAHFSDFHLTAQGRDFDCCLALVMDAKEQGAEHLIMSGDLLDSGQTKVLTAFVAALKKLGWSGSDRLTIVPGNHDIFPVMNPFAKPFIPPVIRRPTAIFHQFIEITRGSRTGKGFRSLRQGAAYPFGKILNERIVLVGLDTTRNGEFNPKNWAGGELSEDQMNAADEFFEEWSHVPHRIVVMHHHPWRENFVYQWIEQNFVKPRPEKVFAWLERSKATLVLCGHVHGKDGIERVPFGVFGQILRSGTAGGINDCEGGVKRRIYHLLDLTPRGGVRIQAREFRDGELQAMADHPPIDR